MSKIHELIRQGDVNGIKELITNNPEAVTSRDEKGFPAIVLSAYLDKIEVTRLLVENGAEVDARDVVGNTALMGAAFKGLKEMVEYLIGAGADPKALNYNKTSAYDLAKKFGQDEVAELLN